MSPPPSSRHEFIVQQLALALTPLARAQGLGMLGAAGIGVKDDHRVPDLTLLRPPAQVRWQPTPWETCFKLLVRPVARTSLG